MTCGIKVARLIINGDDFGISSETNYAIVRAHGEGILTSASLMVNGSAFDDAVALARSCPDLSVGLHLVLVDGRPVSRPEEIPGLVRKDGTFRKNPVRAGMAYFFFRAIAPQIKTELEAQIRKFISTGIPLAHVNGHLHIHMHPTVLRSIIELSGRYGIKAIRLPCEELSINLRLDRRDRVWKLTQWLIFQLLSRHARPRLEARGFRIPDRSYGLLQAGRMNERFLLGLLDEISDGTCEICFHPGAAADWPVYYDGQRELAALLSVMVRDRIRRSGQQLITFSDI